jgi:hypothetical protein
MCNRNKMLGLLVMLIAVAGIVLGQTRSRARSRLVVRPPAVKPAPAKPWVVVHLKQGEPLRGAFLSADAELVQIEVPKGRVTIQTNQVNRLDFNPAVAATRPVIPAPAVAEIPQATAPATPDPQLRLASQVYQALRKLNDAAKIGLPYPQYANLLIETKATVEDALAKLPETAVKGEATSALEAFVDAGQAWSVGLPNGLLPLATEPGATLAKKYAIKPGVNQLGEEDHLRLDTTLSAIWQQAAKHLDTLGGLLKRN